MKTLPPIPFVSNIDTKSRDHWLTYLQAALPDFEIAAFEAHHPDHWPNSTVAIVANPNPEDLKQLAKLEWVQSVWAGVENLVSTLPQDTAIVRMTDPQLAKTMAEAVLTMTLYLHRDLPMYATQQRNRVWQQHDVLLAEDRKITVLGLGALGSAACDSLVRQGFDVSGWSSSPKSIQGVRCFNGEGGLATALNDCDILVVLLPLTDNTTGLLNNARLSMLKQSASIINFARAPIIDTVALLKNLQSGTLKHAVLDVFAIEPLPSDDPLWAVPNITVLPHISAPTNMKTASKIAADNIVSFTETGQLPVVVDRSKGY
ncbi:2-hydroxyacid dehydrogenase [Leucothrix arctica]|uniref:Glyoxylate/hydroxypyruvate reductase A n=1 Tax=Leucothrix arctica TaxID=1481894 RepID=A0A317CM18_9GAMM|nr:glyoxylate/hydroxypyruvate reductase A [Leucothrix arctica]PWQ99635.1 glyoxylate/hydroxypyruvate reductase A [Leucothrix arctica]